MAMRKIPVAWQTGAGGSGVSIFFSPFGVDVSVELATFFNAIKGNFPTAVSWNIPSSGDVIDETTGKITGGYTAATAGFVQGSSAAAYAAGTGCYIRWQTNGIVDGRRVKGRTFLVPIIGTAYQNDGTIIDANLLGMQNAATTLAASGKLNIWHRPTAPGASDGSAHLVTGATGPDKVTSLRSRRV